MYYLVIVDSYSKWPEMFQTRLTTAAATIRFLLETFARFGIPETLITDNGTQFCSSEFKKMCEQLGIIHIRTAPYHPQSNGQAERFVDTLKRYLRKIVEGEEVPSAEALQTFLQVYRSTPSETLAGKSRAEEMMGRSMRTTLDLLKPPVFNNKWKWIPGTVIEVIGGVNFNVLLDYQTGWRKLIRSHVNQLWPRSSDAVKPSAVPTPLEILVGDFELKQQSSGQQAAPPVGTEPVPVDHHQGDSSDNDEFFEAGSTVSSPVQPATVKTPRPVRDQVVFRSAWRITSLVSLKGGDATTPVLATSTSTLQRVVLTFAVI
ncbi:uncharacterized protein K02A2.6-like [Uranotaenia lowii]|uniref:uncharacterized protein K02A2.6-like n=1 Tax=Uranotaenia lowii TaxID=190385 RepID=UPI0024799458|nr:uncharacterized protein K02A2.6-like [Uranotaenia lowii]